jgi:hypothetical protein
MWSDVTLVDSPTFRLLGDEVFEVTSRHFLNTSNLVDLNTPSGRQDSIRAHFPDRAHHCRQLSAEMVMAIVCGSSDTSDLGLSQTRSDPPVFRSTTCGFGLILHGQNFESPLS